MPQARITTASCAGVRWSDPECARVRHKLGTNSGCLFDHLIRPLQERLRDREAEGFRRREVDDELKFGGLLHRQIGGLGALEDLVDVDGQALVSTPAGSA